MQARPLKDRFIDIHNFDVDPLNGDSLQFNLTPKSSQAQAYIHDKKSQPPGSRIFYFRASRPSEKLRWLISFGCIPVQVPGGGDMVYMVAPSEKPPTNAEVLDADAVIQSGGRVAQALDIMDSQAQSPTSVGSPASPSSSGKPKRKGKGKPGKRKGGESKASPKR